MLVRVEGSWEKVEEVFLQTTSKGVLLVTTTQSLEARVQEEVDEGGEEEEEEGVNPPISMPTHLASTRRGLVGGEEGGELLINVIHHPP